VRLGVTPRHSRRHIVNGARNIPWTPLLHGLIQLRIGWAGLYGGNWRAEAVAKVALVGVAMGLFVAHPPRRGSGANEEPDCATGTVPGVEAMRISKMGTHSSELRSA
jgi:hypothetical protein